MTISYRSLKEEAKPRATCYISCSAISVMLAALVVIFNTALFPIVFQKIVNQQVAITNGTLSFEQWLKPTPKIYKIVTVYNLTNTDDVSNGSQPILNPIGPYYFREYRQKINVEEVYDDELWFNEKKWYKFDHNATVAANPNNSHLDPQTDMFTTINLAYVGAVYNATTFGVSFIKKMGILAAAEKSKEQTLFMTRNVSSVIFGYKDEMLEILHLVEPDIPETVQVMFNMSEVDIEQRSIINTGRKDPSKLGQYRMWEGHASLPYWASPEANTVNGTEGLFFYPNLNKSKTVTTFTDDLYRASPMEYFEDDTILGIHCYKYRIPDYAMKNSSDNPLNAGFYSYGPTGTMNLTAPTRAPIFVSKPSFLDAEEYLYKEVTGLAPAQRSMDTYICVEPTTGVLVKALKQLQVNVLLTRTEEFPGFNNLREKPRVIPMALVIETGGMDQDLVNTFKNKVFVPRTVFIGVLWGVFGLLILVPILLLSLLHKHLKDYENEESKPIITKEEATAFINKEDDENIYSNT